MLLFFKTKMTTAKIIFKTLKDYFIQPMTKNLIRKSLMYVFWLHVQKVDSTSLPKTIFSSDPTVIIAKTLFKHKLTGTERTGEGTQKHNFGNWTIDEHTETDLAG